MPQQAANRSRRLPLQISPGPPTGKDDAGAADVLVLRRLLLQEASVRERLDGLVTLRPIGRLVAWDPRAGLEYYLALGRLVADLDYAWTEAELNDIVTRWATPGWSGIGPLLYHDLPYRDQVANGGGTIGVGFAAGRVGYSRQLTADTVGRAARAIAFHVGALRGQRPTT